MPLIEPHSLVFVGQVTPMLKWSHPEWFDFLITPMTTSHAEVAQSYHNGEPGMEALSVKTIFMTQDEMDKLPEFDG